jgi:hypothetical protein
LHAENSHQTVRRREIHERHGGSESN